MDKTSDIACGAEEQRPVSSDLDTATLAEAVAADLADMTVRMAPLANGLSVKAFADKFADARKKAEEKRDSLQRAANILKRNYEIERERLLRAQEDTAKVLRAISAAVDILSPTAPEEPIKAKPVRKPRKTKH